MSASRKYQRYFKPISRTPFSTAGTIRAQGRVGQTSLSRNTARTPFKGTAPVGNGGDGGRYVTSIVVSCNESSPSNGQTTMTSRGHILTSVVHPTAVFNSDCATNKCGATQTVKDFSPENASQSTLLQKNNASVMQRTWPDLTGILCIPPADCTACEPHFIGSRKFTSTPYTKRVASVSSSDYMRTQYLYKNPTEQCCDKVGQSSIPLTFRSSMLTPETAANVAFDSSADPDNGFWSFNNTTKSFTFTRFTAVNNTKFNFYTHSIYENFGVNLLGKTFNQINGISANFNINYANSSTPYIDPPKLFIVIITPLKFGPDADNKGGYYNSIFYYTDVNSGVIYYDYNTSLSNISSSFSQSDAIGAVAIHSSSTEPRVNWIFQLESLSLYYTTL